MTFGLREREREMANSIPIFRERESKWKIPIQFSGTGTVIKIPFPFSGTGMRVKNSIPDFRDGNWRTVFPGIPGKSWEFPGSGIPGIAKSTAGPKIGGEAKTQEVVQDGGDNCCNFVSHLLCLSCDHPRQGEPRFYLDPFVCHRNELLKALSPYW